MKKQSSKKKHIGHEKRTSSLKICIGQAIQKKIPELLKQNYVCVNYLVLSHDFSQAKAYVSFLYEKEADKLLVMDTLNFYVPVLKKYISQQLRHQMRRIPQLRFFYDDLMEKQTRVNHLLNSYSTQ